MQWSSSRLSHHVARMEQRGLIERNHSDHDGRGAVIELTTEGLWAIWDAAPEHARSVRRHFIDLLSPEQLESLEAIADVVVNHVASISDAGGAP